MITDKLARIVQGHDAMAVAGSFDAMIKAIGNAGRAGVVGDAISAVDVALGRRSREPHHLVRRAGDCG